MTVPVAHAGEEILIPLVPALIFLVVYMIRARRAQRRDDLPGRCAYCGNELEPEVERCPRCGFKVSG